MAREGLLGDLRPAILAAGRTGASVKREGVRVRNDAGMSVVQFEVIPFEGAAHDHYFLVLFGEMLPEQEAAPVRGKKGKKAAEPAPDSRDVTRLKRELEATREYLQSIIEEQEAMNEELRSANEEIQSSNEELRSVNEELETAKEELQSSNEELTTLNEELENRNHELAQVNDDLVNLLASVDIPIVMLDAGLRVRRFNPGAQRIVGLIPGDVGRPIHDLRTTLQIDDLEALIANVVDNLEMRELEVQDRSGRWYSLRIHPCRTTENKIDGAVLVLVDIDRLRRSPAR